MAVSINSYCPLWSLLRVKLCLRSYKSTFTRFYIGHEKATFSETKRGAILVRVVHYTRMEAVMVVDGHMNKYFLKRHGIHNVMKCRKCSY